MVSVLTHAPSLIWRYLRNGEVGLADVEEAVEAAAHDQPGGKFGKREAKYLPQAPIPPTLWRTSCGRCRFWEAGEPGEPGQCHIVGRPDDPYGGEDIHYRGWCAYWMPPEGEPAFEWIRQRLDPDGRSSVRGEYDREQTQKRRQRQERHKASTATTEPAARSEAIREEAETDDD